MINDKILIQVHTYFRHIFVVRHGLQKNEYSTNMTLSLWKIHLYLWMSFGTQIRTALRITTWKEHAISYFQIFIFTRVNVLKIVCGWIYENSAIQTHFLSFIKIRMQYPFDRKIPCLMKYASKWNAAARVTYHQHWARIVYPPSISFYYLDFLPVTVGKISLHLLRRNASQQFLLLSTKYMPHLRLIDQYTSSIHWMSASPNDRDFI